MASHISRRYGKDFRLSGLIYVHRISDTRVGGSSRRNLRMFQELCGSESLKNVVIVTTMWDKVTPEEGSQREQELASSKDLLQLLLEGGATMIRHKRTTETANNVINHLLKKDATNTQIAHELGEEKKALEATAAGSELHSEIKELMKKHEAELGLIKSEMKLARSEASEGTTGVNHRLAKLMTALDELKRGTGPITGYASLTNMC